MVVNNRMRANVDASRKVVTFDRCTQPQIDYSVVADLRENLGDLASQELIERAAVDLSDRLHLLSHAMDDQDYERVRKLSKSIASVSTQIGLVEFSKAALNLYNCAMSADFVARISVYARLVKVGELSLVCVIGLIDFPD